MLIAIVSDTHSRHPTLARALAVIRDRRVQTMIHCGDIEESTTVEFFRGFDAHFVFGNCDHDRDNIRTAIQAAGLRLHEPFGDLEIDGVRLGWTHGDNQGLLRDLENSGHFDYLFYGHTHQPEEHRVGSTRVINPGALHRANPKQFALLDLETGLLERLTVE